MVTPVETRLIMHVFFPVHTYPIRTLASRTSQIVRDTKSLHKYTATKNGKFSWYEIGNLSGNILLQVTFSLLHLGKRSSFGNNGTKQGSGREGCTV